VTYIGQQPSTTFDSGIQDRFTGLTTNTVTLTHDISAETDILVVWNNIVQDSSTYSVGGVGNKTLTLGGTLVSADIVTVYYTNKVMQSVNPTANSVGITELNLSDGSNGQAITTNGSGTLAFSSVSADADNYFATSGLSSKDLGSGLHIKTGDCGGGTIAAGRDELVIEGSGSTGMTLIGGTGNDIGIGFGDSDNTNIGLINYNNSSNYMTFQTNDSERMRLTTGGNLGIANNAPNAALEVSPTTSEVVIRATGNSQSNELIRWNNTNTTSSNHTISFFKRNNTTTGSIAHTNNSTSFNTSSDYRLKENEVALSDGITRLKTLKPYRFNFKTDADKTVDGFFAHEVSSVVPEAITGDKNAVDSEGNIEPQAIDQSKLVPLLTSALQEAITKIETLEARVKTLEDA